MSQGTISPELADRILDDAKSLLKHWPKGKREYGEAIIDAIEGAVTSGDARSFSATRRLVRAHHAKARQAIFDQIFSLVASIFEARTGINLRGSDDDEEDDE